MFLGFFPRPTAADITADYHPYISYGNFFDVGHRGHPPPAVSGAALLLSKLGNLEFYIGVHVSELSWLGAPENLSRGAGEREDVTWSRYCDLQFATYLASWRPPIGLVVCRRSSAAASGWLTRYRHLMLRA